MSREEEEGKVKKNEGVGVWERNATRQSVGGLEDIIEARQPERQTPPNAGLARCNGSVCDTLNGEEVSCSLKAEEGKKHNSVGDNIRGHIIDKSRSAPDCPQTRARCTDLLEGPFTCGLAYRTASCSARWGLRPAPSSLASCRPVRQGCGVACFVLHGWGVVKGEDMQMAQSRLRLSPPIHDAPCVPTDSADSARARKKKKLSNQASATPGSLRPRRARVPQVAVPGSSPSAAFHSCGFASPHSPARQIRVSRSRVPCCSRRFLPDGPPEPPPRPSGAPGKERRPRGPIRSALWNGIPIIMIRKMPIPQARSSSGLLPAIRHNARPRYTESGETSPGQGATLAAPLALWLAAESRASPPSYVLLQLMMRDLRNLFGYQIDLGARQAKLSKCAHTGLWCHHGTQFSVHRSISTVH
ncbi:hypothetical protein FH972_022667 [Carpinus fangiana]|uniref:Uncharacterized protein n=1 Tax=Carpinus fangiana TaxID=176857 RepID=A0A5N6KV52_9ROSI|nr:hypothetical protein FH972_022667 [Carpinus fangiana]